tara:strand:- start:2104 stop:3627 length:1524 start_codon:yes stop_codon:yes gene_type:complete
MQLDWFEKSFSSISKGFPKKMVLFDCETTGGNPNYHRIIEVGLLIIENGLIIERWQSFVNPGVIVPELITKITGIDSEMIRNAPDFEQLSNKIEEVLKDRVFVAHNARFDYGFLKAEFARLGLKVNSKTLCSVKLSRYLYPQFKSHGLSAIIKRFDLPIANRHRALDDAEMIAEFFIRTSQIFDIDAISSACASQFKRPSIPPNVAVSEIDKLPQKPGVYYFYDKDRNLLYIGKSININNRVMSHFYSDHKNSKDFKLNLKISHIDFKETISDFSAQLLESKEIKSLNPIYNRRLKKTKHLYQIKTKTNDHGYKEIDIEKVQINNELLLDRYGLFRSLTQAKKQITKLVDEYSLCHQLSCLEKSKNKACFRTQLNKCFGACVNQESASDYNLRVDSAVRKYQRHIWPYAGPILIEEKSTDSNIENAYHLISDWKYIGQIKNEEDFYNFGLSGSSRPILKIPSEKINSLQDFEFDLDTYHILIKFLLAKSEMNNLRILNISKVLDNHH